MCQQSSSSSSMTPSTTTNSSSSRNSDKNRKTFLSSTSKSFRYPHSTYHTEEDFNVLPILDPSHVPYRIAARYILNELEKHDICAPRVGIMWVSFFITHFCSVVACLFIIVIWHESVKKRISDSLNQMHPTIYIHFYHNQQLWIRPLISLRGTLLYATQTNHPVFIHPRLSTPLHCHRTCRWTSRRIFTRLHPHNMFPWTIS